MKKFLKEIETGDIHFRDKWQFELKSEFSPLPDLKSNTYTQEFYCFIPNSFQINNDTYSKEDFYRDQTNMIRYKTPEFSIEELLDPNNPKSPLFRIKELRNTIPSEDNISFVEDELKLLGNIVRSSMRETARTMILELQEANNPSEINANIATYCQQILVFREIHLTLQTNLLETWSKSLQSSFLYVDEFISNAINYYLTGLLDSIRKSPQADALTPADRELCQVLIKEKHHRESRHQEPQQIDEGSLQNEFIFYRSGLLNKYVMDVLMLTVNRSSLAKKFRNVIGAFSAGIAMLIYVMLLVWQGEIFAINSQPFILITVVLYILKDRIKEGLKAVSYRQASHWYSDYTTDIRSPDEKFYLGKVMESFSFIPEKKVSKEIASIRNKEFHTVLEKFKRPERVFYYKRTVNITKKPQVEDLRRHDLNIIFRFNIQSFLTKLANPYDTYVTLDPSSLEFIRTRLPKVYHLNIIMRNTYIQKDLSEKVELRKFRLIIDKNGIKRVEQVTQIPSERTNSRGVGDQ